MEPRLFLFLLLPCGIMAGSIISTATVFNCVEKAKRRLKKGTTVLLDSVEIQVLLNDDLYLYCWRRDKNTIPWYNKTRKSVLESQIE